jgi:hypothetical protein
MFIPTPVQELHLPLTQKLEVGPVLPVTAVPGVAEEAQSLDSRVALQWTQPVFAGAEGQAGRSALTAPLPEALLKSPKTAVPSYEPQGADPDALKSGDVHPLLAQGLSSWLSGVLAKSIGNADANAANLRQMMANASAMPKGNQADLNDVLTNMPSGSTAGAAKTSTQANLSTPAEVLSQLKNIYQAIAGSDVFAAQRLNEAWMPRKLEPKQSPKLEAFKNLEAEAFEQLAQPIQDPSAAQLTQWVSALEPDSDAAEQAARMLTHGNMVWQAELVPGLPMRIVREDAWRNNPEQAGQLEKGAMLKVEITLPNLGALRIVGSQWGQDISLHISHGTPESNDKVNWTALAPELLQELKAQGLSDVKFDSLLGEPAQTAVIDTPREAPNV